MWNIFFMNLKNVTILVTADIGLMSVFSPIYDLIEIESAIKSYIMTSFKGIKMNNMT